MIRNIQSLILFVALSMPLFACNPNSREFKEIQVNPKPIKGNGKLESIQRPVGDFDAIKLVGSLEVELISGESNIVTVEGESNLLPYVLTTVKNGELTITTESHTNLQPSKKMKLVVRVPSKAIIEIAIIGSGDVKSNEVLTQDRFAFSVTGSGDVKIKVAAKQITTLVTGSGEIDLTGNVENLEATVTGSGEIDAEKLIAQSATTLVSGSGEIEVQAMNILEATIQGSGDINYIGTPKMINKKIVGSGEISQKMVK
jgi:hypothetical protein